MRTKYGDSFIRAGVADWDIKSGVFAALATGAAAEEPFLAGAIRHFDTDLRVVGGSIADVGGQTVARFRVAVPPEVGRPAVVDYLRSRGVQAEVPA